MYKYFRIKLREYIFIILTATIFSITFFSKSFSKENIFVIDNVKVETQMSIDFSREKYINKAFLYSFDMLMSKILLTEDLNKLNNVKLNQIKILINSFQIIEETYQQGIYKATFNIFYNGRKVKKFLVQKNISYSEPKNISAVFFPILFVKDRFLNFDENYFYNQWPKLNIENELINFILPIEDLDDIKKIKEIKNQVEEFNFDDLIKKYNTTNYVVTMMNYQNNRLSIYLKTNFNYSESSKNISYELININDEAKLTKILSELKIIITDIWKSENIINLAIPLSIKVKFEYNKPEDLDMLNNTFYKINIIDKYFLEEFNTNNSFFKIYYYGNPKKLSNELLEFGYHLRSDQGKWEIYKDE